MKPIIFIGLIGAGKSTISKMIAEKPSIPSLSLDEEEYLAVSVGYDIERYKRMYRENGLLDAYETTSEGRRSATIGRIRVRLSSELSPHG